MAASFEEHHNFRQHTVSAGFTKMPCESGNDCSSSSSSGEDYRLRISEPLQNDTVHLGGWHDNTQDIDNISSSNMTGANVTYRQRQQEKGTKVFVGQQFGTISRGLLQPGGAGTVFGPDVNRLQLQQPGLQSGTLKRRLRAGVSDSLVAFVDMSRESFYLLYQELACSLQLGQHDLFVPKDAQSPFATINSAGQGLQSLLGAVDSIDGPERSIGELGELSRTRIIAQAQAQKRTLGAKNALSKAEIKDNFKEDPRAKGVVNKAVNIIRQSLSTYTGVNTNGLNGTDRWIIGLSRSTDTRTILVAVATCTWHETIYPTGAMTPNDVMYNATVNQMNRQIAMFADPNFVQRLVRQVRSSSIQRRT
jgi:hypothetical protein